MRCLVDLRQFVHPCQALFALSLLKTRPPPVSSFVCDCAASHQWMKEQREQQVVAATPSKPPSGKRTSLYWCLGRNLAWFHHAEFGHRRLKLLTGPLNNFLTSCDQFPEMQQKKKKFGPHCLPPVGKPEHFQKPVQIPCTAELRIGCL